jgi:hypothetical protein
MADQLSLRGGTTTEHATFTGANKEVTVDTTKKTLVVNDGATVGGHPLMRENASNSALALGSAGTPSLKFTGDTNTGIYSPGADQVSIATNGTERLRVNNAGQIEAVSLGTAAAPTFSFTGDPNTGIYSPGANQLAVATNGVGRLFIDASGNVGLETSSTTLWGYANLAGGTTVHRLLARQADAFFGISGTSTTAELNFGLLNALSSPTLVARISTVNTITTNNGERADLAFYTKSGVVSTVAQERLRITSAGLVGIGTSAPGALLDLRQPTSASEQEHLRIVGGQRSSDGFAVGVRILTGAVSSNSNRHLRIINSGNTIFQHYETSSNTPVPDRHILLCPDGGNVGIGTTTPDVSLHVEGIGTQRVKIEATDTSVAGLIMLNTNRRYDVQVNGSDLQIYDNTASAERVRLDASGRLLIGTSSGTHNLDMGQQLLPVSTTETKSIYRFGNASGLKRKFNLTTVAADRALFSIACGAAGVSNKVALEITVFLTGEKSGVSSDRVFTGKWSVVRGDAGTFTIANVYSAGNAGAATVTASGNNVNINAIFSVVSGGGCFVEIKGLLGTANQGSAENGFTVTMPAI